MAQATSTPFVTIAIPCLNEEHYIEACLDDVFAQDYPAASMEVLVGDGMSTDRTREILERIGERHPGRLRVIDNPRRLQAAAMNEMIDQARGEIIVRLDVHCRYAPDYVRQCVAALNETGAQNVGGSQRALPKTWFQKALCAALDSPIAVGGAKYRSPDMEGFVDTVFLGAFRRKVFDIVGGYDPNAITNEDAELNQRILEAGGKIFLSKKIVVHYFPRDSFKSLAKQYFKYGRGRARTLLKHRTLPTPRPALPFLMVASGAALLATSPFHPFTPPAFGLYGAMSIVEAVRVSRRHGLRYAPVVALIFPVLHVSHGVGFGAGLVRYALSPDWTETPPPPKNAFATTNGVHVSA
ncbi:MAG TPA: glycosyltransferase family 2 protein [Labilithrix sp.]|nr:glycosyltransferase family 2 protein [Labilithrix sp.]